MTFLFAGLACGLAMVLGATACGSSTVPPPDPGKAVVLRLPIPRDIVTLDPKDGGDVNTYNVLRQIYEGLVDLDGMTLPEFDGYVAG